MFDVYINNVKAGEVVAPNYREARKVARAVFGRRCDVIGLADKFLANVAAIMGDSI